MAEMENRRLIRERILSEVDADEATHGLAVVERFLRSRIGEIEPLLQKVDPQHALKRDRRSAALAFGIVRRDQREQHGPRHDSVHLGQEPLALGDLGLGAPRFTGECALLTHIHSRKRRWTSTRAIPYRGPLHATTISSELP